VKSEDNEGANEGRNEGVNEGVKRGLRGGREGVEPLPPHPEAPFYKGVSEDLEGLGVFS